MRTKGAATVCKWSKASLTPAGIALVLISGCASGDGRAGAAEANGEYDPAEQHDSGVDTSVTSSAEGEDEEGEQDEQVCVGCDGSDAVVRRALVEPASCEPACQNGGECVSGACVCPEGGSGVACEIVDEPFDPNGPTLLDALCAQNPCLNGGVCVAEGETIRCVCAKGFSGPVCDAPAETVPCAEEP